MSARSPRLLIFLTVAIDLLGFGIVIPILPAVGAHFLGPEDQAIISHGTGAALLMLAYSLLQMLFSPIWGRLSDRHGRRPIILLSLAGSTAAYLMFALAPGFWVLLFSRVLAGICGANLSAAQAYIADVTPERERTGAMGMIGVAFGLGFVLGPVVGGGATRIGLLLGVPESIPHFSAGVAAAVICGLNLTWAALALPESLPKGRRGATGRRRTSWHESMRVLRDPVVGALIIMFLVSTLAFAKLEVVFSLYAKDVYALTLEQIYGLFVFLGVVMALVQGWLIRRLVNYIPETWLLIGGSLLLALGLAAFPLVEGPGVGLFVILALLAFGQGLAQPSVMGLVSRHSHRERQGRAMGTLHAAGSLARIIGPVAGGMLYNASAGAPFYAAGGLMLAAVGWAVLTRRRIVQRRIAPL